MFESFVKWKWRRNGWFVLGFEFRRSTFKGVIIKRVGWFGSCFSDVNGTCESKIKVVNWGWITSLISNGVIQERTCNMAKKIRNNQSRRVIEERLITTKIIAITIAIVAISKVIIIVTSAKELKRC